MNSSAAPPQRRTRQARPGQRADAEHETELLLRWYTKHQRPLPWRQTKDPYAIWVSEVMLQQTQVATVIDYYRRWLERFPTVNALARASEDEVLHAWQGLGYYSRARRLLEGARYLVREHGQELPRTLSAWLNVPGVGRYTAGAVTSIAFGAKTPVVDGNVMRVLCRLYALEGNPQRAPLAAELWRRAEALLVTGAPGDVNQAMMELGATVCLPKAPKCGACPWRSRCRAHERGQPERYPELPERPKPTQVVMACGLVARGERVLLAQQPPDAARWASMWLFPNLEVDAEPDAASALLRELGERYGVRGRVLSKFGTFKHAVTRYRITLHAYACQVDGAGRPRSGARWWSGAELGELALPAVHRRIASQWLAKSGSP